MHEPLPSDPRRARGRLGEALAREHLERAGYRILECNFRCRRGELDLVVADREAIVFCEVKTRVVGSTGGPGSPLDSIGVAKRRQLRLLAAEWLRANSDRAVHRPVLRFDAIGVTVDPTGRLVALEHVEGAF
jgi:putative endonuclease